MKSIRVWRDLEDGHLYQPGDDFPHDGRVITKERIAELAGTQNKAGFALIKADEAPAEGKPIEATGTAKKAVRGRKKAT